MVGSAVGSRAVFFVGGYDPKSPEEFFGRLDRENGRSAALWESETRIGPVHVEAEGDAASVAIETEGAGWRCRTDFTFLVLDRIVLADFARALPVRLGKYLLAFGRFVGNGTAFRIFRHAWRFGLYFLFPFACVLAFAALGVGAGWVAFRLSGMGWLGAGLAVLVFFALLRVLGTRWPVLHLMDLWSFSDGFIRGKRPDAEALMDRLARLITAKVAEGRYGEVLLVGHSTGGLLILDIAARCSALDPGFSTRAEQVGILTLGSTALKGGLHPAARRFREGVARLAADPHIGWFEVQCMTDIINFHRTEPASLMGAKTTPERPFALVRDVQVKRMVAPEQYRRMRRSFFRIHYQYVSGNTRRYFYDFFLVCCGPATLLGRMRSRGEGPWAGARADVPEDRTGHAA